MHRVGIGHRAPLAQEFAIGVVKVAGHDVFVAFHQGGDVAVSIGMIVGGAICIGPRQEATDAARALDTAAHTGALA